jgi:hypothetical protein
MLVMCTRACIHIPAARVCDLRKYISSACTVQATPHGKRKSSRGQKAHRSAAGHAAEDGQRNHMLPKLGSAMWTAPRCYDPYIV